MVNPTLKKWLAEGQKKQNLLIGLGIIFLVIAAVFYFKSSSKEKTLPPAPPPEEIIVQEKGTVRKTGEVVQPMTAEEVKKIREEIDGVLSSAGETAVLEDVAGGSAAGEAKKAFSDGKFYYRATATGLKPAGKGFFYEGWLEKDNNLISIGRMEVDSQGGGALYYTASVDKSDYAKTIITLEPEDGNPQPSTHILEGSF